MSRDRVADADARLEGLAVVLAGLLVQVDRIDLELDRLRELIRLNLRGLEEWRRARDHERSPSGQDV